MRSCAPACLRSKDKTPLVFLSPTLSSIGERLHQSRTHILSPWQTRLNYLSPSLASSPQRERERGESACEWRTKLITKDDGCTSLFFSLRFLHDFLTSGLFLSFLALRPRLDEKTKKNGKRNIRTGKRNRLRVPL